MTNASRRPQARKTYRPHDVVALYRLLNPVELAARVKVLRGGKNVPKNLNWRIGYEPGRSSRIAGMRPRAGEGWAPDSAWSWALAPNVQEWSAKNRVKIFTELGVFQHDGVDVYVTIFAFMSKRDMLKFKLRWL